MSDQLKQVVKQHIANIDDEESLIEEKFFEIDSKLQKIKSNVDSNPELAKKTRQGHSYLGM